MNIAIVCGARPNFIKVAPIIRTIRNNKSYSAVNYQLIYTGTADDPSLEASLFTDLEIGRPDVFLDVDCENLNELTGQVMSSSLLTTLQVQWQRLSLPRNRASN